MKYGCIVKHIKYGAALVSATIIGYLFLYDVENAVVDSDERNRGMSIAFLWHQLGDMDLDELRLQQDGATYHTVRKFMTLLAQKFPNRLMSSLSKVNWSARYCDLTLC